MSHVSQRVSRVCPQKREKSGQPIRDIPNQAALLMMRMNSNVHPNSTSKGFEFNAIPSALVDITAAYCCAHAKLVSDKEKSQIIQ